jgi:hypothetical protein
MEQMTIHLKDKRGVGQQQLSVLLPCGEVASTADIRFCYQFTRRIGSWPIALLTASTLESFKKWLHQAKQVLKATFYPAKAIEPKHNQTESR